MNIYIASFDIQWKNKDLETLFSPFGEVSSAAIEIDAFTDKSRGFGYVEMPDESQAKSAIEALDKSTVEGHQITVQEAEPKELRRGSYKVGSASVNPYRFKKN
ncbi:MAG: RNA-binding protein [Chitinophagaceae bacterium]|nr:MAG: RNA-binding protein [Chitinophagaceae bacterium]